MALSADDEAILAPSTLLFYVNILHHLHDDIILQTVVFAPGMSVASVIMAMYVMYDDEGEGGERKEEDGLIL